MFLQRALISFTLGPLALYLIYLGGWFYFIPITLILLLATVEYHQLIRKIGLQSSAALLVPLVFVTLVAGQFFEPRVVLTAVLFGLFGALCFGLWLYERRMSETTAADWFAMSAGVVLLGWFGSHFLQIRGLEQMAWQWTMAAMLSTWIADSGAYVVGRFLAGTVFGRHRMSPRLSPNKTIEGYIGGIVLGTLLTVAIGNYLHLPLSAALALGLLVSMFSPAGDLGISLLKREAGVKDSGHVFGSHGGALDRVDSLIWSVTLAYYLALFVTT
ncbi:MAG: phosphatidate cytidylyltransferase [Anaerolineales bacterium]|nr:phosphatidate cytidylyltransferase [Anaerolineales bacterium]